MTHSPDPQPICLASESDTVRFAQLLAEHLPLCCVVAIDGTLGAGKTRLVRAFAKACDVSESQVTSPTFTLWQTYRGLRTIHHLDAYRIADDDEFLELGVDECFEQLAVTFIEWAERIARCLPHAHFSLRLEVDEHDAGARLAFLSTTDPQLQDCVEKIVAAWRPNS